MKTFEEKFTAWIDGRLSGVELAAFERELDVHPEAIAEKEASLEIGNLLRAHIAAPPLHNGEFFNQEILKQIAPPARRPGAIRRGFWSLPRMALSGAVLLILSTVLYFAAVPDTKREVRHNEQYVSNVLNARSDDPNVTATAFHSKQENVNVLWLDGLDYIPPDHKLK